MVKLDGVFDFLNFVFVTDYGFAFEDGSNLVDEEGVSFDGEGALDGADAVGFTEVGLGFWVV